MATKVTSHKKRIDENYQWRYPTIVDRHPELIEYLKTNPNYVDALYYRRLLLKRLPHLNDGHSDRPELDLWNLKDPEPHLKLIK
ncbi:MAG: hypothetical protein A4S09_06295 [Proteobacteria bacterium SG_bin7]|nr:MAG: hypothetical protein A4S09_06295 [Proteobacteria bacterium SG_bin7]